jgi:predicted hydrocarbon binding protein
MDMLVTFDISMFVFRFRTMSDGIPSNKKYYPNKMGRFFLAALQETLIQDGYTELLEWAGLAHYAESLPADNWTREFDFSHIATLNQGLFELFGPRGGRRLALSTGSGFFRCALEEIGVLAGVTDLARRSLPLQTKLKDGLTAAARTFSQTSDQTTWLVEQELQFFYHVDPCPICWQRTSERPICFITVGLLQEALGWLSDGQDFRVQQIACKAMGEESCIFRIDRDPVK